MTRAILWCAMWSGLASGMSARGEFVLAERQVLWEQVKAEPSFDLTIERQVYTPLDRAGRFVMAVQVGRRGPKLDQLRVEWSIEQEDRTVASGVCGISKGLVSVDFDPRSLAPGRYEVRAKLLVQGKEPERDEGFFLIESAEAPPDRGKVALLLPRGVPEVRGGCPVHFGVPFPKGALTEASRVRVLDGRGKALPTSAVVRSRWGCHAESSIRWLGVDVQLSPAPATEPGGSPSEFSIEFGPEVESPAPPQAAMVTQENGLYRVDTGPLEFVVRPGRFNLFDRVSLGGRKLFDAGHDAGAYLVDHEGEVYRSANDRNATVTVEEATPLRAVLRAEGWFVKDGTEGKTHSFSLPTDRLCKFITRIEAYAGKPYVRLLHTWIITYDSFAIRLRDVGLRLPVPGATRARFGVEEGDPVSVPVPAEGVYLLQHRPDQFDISRGEGTLHASGRRSDGTVIAEAGATRVGLSLRETWQRYPKEFEVGRDAIQLHFWPSHGRDHPEVEIYARDRLHQQWYNHQGREMNLSVPWDALFAYAKIVGNGSFGIYKPLGNIMGGVHASAMGVAQTSDVLVCFTDGGGEPEVVSAVAAHQAAPHALPDPAWLNETKAQKPLAE